MEVVILETLFNAMREFPSVSVTEEQYLSTISRESGGKNWSRAALRNAIGRLRKRGLMAAGDTLEITDAGKSSVAAWRERRGVD